MLTFEKKNNFKQIQKKMKKASSPPKLYKISYFEQKIVRNSTLNFVLIRTILPRMQEKKTEKEISGKEKKGY